MPAELVPPSPHTHMPLCPTLLHLLHTGITCLVRYFYIPARKEHRGLGGIFFDDLDAAGAPYDVGAYVRDVAAGVLPSWRAIAERR